MVIPVISSFSLSYVSETAFYWFILTLFHIGQFFSLHKHMLIFSWLQPFWALLWRKKLLTPQDSTDRVAGARESRCLIGTVTLRDSQWVWRRGSLFIWGLIVCISFLIWFNWNIASKTGNKARVIQAKIQAKDEGSKRREPVGIFLLIYIALLLCGQAFLGNCLHPYQGKNAEDWTSNLFG